tara:strand:+ start:1000 stop:1314 length:315 start_codon:yes stop_codon:yes gene_type:complete
MTTQEKVIKWFYLKEIAARVDDGDISIYVEGLLMKLSPLQVDYIARNYDTYGPKTNDQIIDDISDAIVYISRNMHHFQGDESDLNDYKEMLRGLSQAMTLIKQL